MGCAFMRLNKLEETIKSLGEAVRINENDGEIWGNISSCLVFLKNSVKHNLLQNKELNMLVQIGDYGIIQWVFLYGIRSLLDFIHVSKNLCYQIIENQQMNKQSKRLHKYQPIKLIN